MQRSELLAIVDRLCDVEIDALERDELAAVVATTARVRGWLDATELRCARRGRNLADAGTAEPAPSLLARNGNRSNRDANQIDRRNKVAEAMPTFEDGLGDGTVSAGHLDAIANATRTAPPEVRAAFATHEDELLALAASDTVEVFTRRCRALVAQLTAELTDNDASEFDRQRAASKISQWFNPDDGLHHTHAALDPLRHEILWNAINRSLRRRQRIDGNARTPWNQMQVDALIDAVQGGAPEQPWRNRPASAPANAPTSAPTSGRPPAPTTASAPAPAPAASTPPPSPAADIARDLANAVDRCNAVADRDPAFDPEHHDAAPCAHHPAPDAHSSDTPDDDGEDETVMRRIEQRVTEVSVLVDLATLTEGLHAKGICETEDGIALPVSTVRRLCCDAEIIPIVLGADGVALDVGRTARTVNRGQRRALRAMHRTCAHPDCDVPFGHTKVHHVRWWIRDCGPTDIDNLLALCERHHHLVHEGGWGLTMTPDRIATWTRPDGVVAHRGCTIDRAPAAPPHPPPQE